MGSEYLVYINIQGKTEDINEFWDKHCRGGFYQSFFPEFDSWPFESEYRRDDNEIRIKFVQGSRSRPLDAFEEIMKMYRNSDLTMAVFIDFEGAAYWLVENKEHNRDKFTPDVTSKSAEILDFLDNKYDLIPAFGNVATLEDDGSNEWKQLVAYRNVFRLKNQNEFPCDTLLSDLSLNYSGNRTIDKVKTIDFAKDIIDKYEPENFVFRINSKSESEELVKILKNSYETVKITKPPMLRKRSSARYVVCLNATDELMNITKYQSFDSKHYLD